MVRVAAARTIARWNPASPIDAGDAVIQALSDAVLASGIRTAQLVMGDSRKTNRIASMLRDLNLETYTPVQTVERGYDSVVNSATDVVFLDESVGVSVGGGDVGAVNYFIGLIRKNYRSANVPVVVVVADSDVERARELYENEERKVLVVSDSIDSTGLRNEVLYELFADKEDAKERATRLAASAAEAIEYLSFVHTRLPVQKSAPHLVKVLKNRPDSVRIPCIRALGHLKYGEAAGELSMIFSEASNSVEVRAAAMTSLGQTLEGDLSEPSRPQGDSRRHERCQPGVAARVLVRFLERGRELRAASGRHDGHAPGRRRAGGRRRGRVRGRFVKTASRRGATAQRRRAKVLCVVASLRETLFVAQPVPVGAGPTERGSAWR